MLRKPSTRPVSSVFSSVADWFGKPTSPRAQSRQGKSRGRRLGFESLEGRVVLAVSPGALIEGTVFNDLNGAGVPSDGPGIQNVTVNLFLDGGNGTFQGTAAGSDDTLVGTQLTNASGAYSFANLAAGTYFVQEIVPAGFVSEVGNNSVATVVVSPTAAAGVEGPVIDTFDTTNQTVDASSTGMTSVASSVAAPEAIGGNRDLIAQLTSQFGDVSLTANAFNEHVLEFNSSAQGAGNRIVDWDGPNSGNPSVLNPTGLGGVDLTGGGAATGISLKLGAEPDGGVLTLNIYKDAGDFSTTSVTIPNTGGTATATLFLPFSSFTVGAGTGANFSDVGAIQMKIEGNPAANGEVDTVAAFGPTPFVENFANYQPASIGNTVFWDLNKNGIHDTSEPNVPGVTVQLVQSSTVIATTTTGAGGTYSFTNLAPGAYSVEFEPPHGSLFTLEGQGGDPTLDSDVDPSTGSTPTFGLTSGENDVTRNAGLVPIDLSLVKTVDNSTPAVGSNVNFTVTLSNAAGFSQATGVAVTDLLPAGLTFVSDTPAQGTYNSTTGVWTVGTLASGASTSLVITATVTSAGTKTNTGTVTAADEADAAPQQNLTSSASVNPSQSVDLQLTKVVDNSTPNVGKNVTFTVTLSDLGPGNATGVAVTDQLPAGLTFVSDTASQGTYNSTTGIWTVGSVSTTNPLTLQIVATVATAGAKVNTAQITAEDQQDTDSENNEDSATVTPQESDLSLTKTVDDATPSIGQNVTFTVTVSNSGPNTATDVVTTDLLPAGLTFVSDTASQGTYNSTTGAWTIGTLTSGATPVTLTVTATAATMGAKVNTATVTGDQFDPTLENNTDSATVTPQEADVSLTKTVNNPTPTVGQNVIFTITVSNAGPSTATDVVTTDVLPAGLTFVSDTASQGTYNSTTGAWTIGSLASGATPVTLAITATVATAGAKTNTATVTEDQFDPTLSNNTASATVTPESADLSLTKTVNNSAPAVGQNVIFTVTVSNTGPNTATDVVTTDPLPTGLTFVSDTASQGTYNSTTGIWTIGSLASGATPVTLRVTATVASTGAKVNTATVTADQADPTLSNNTATATVTPSTEPRLSKAYFLGR